MASDKVKSDWQGSSNDADDSGNWKVKIFDFENFLEPLGQLDRVENFALWFWEREDISEDAWGGQDSGDWKVDINDGCEHFFWQVLVKHVKSKQEGRGI